MSDFRADLHCHSTCSDGSLSPEQIVYLAKQIGLSGLSITDHDTIEAYATANPLCKTLGLTLIPGVEFSAAWKNISVHVLGYGFSLSDPNIHAFCTAHAKRRLERNQAIMERLNKHNMPLTYEEIIGATDHSCERKSIGRPHIALAMMQKGYVESIKEAFKLYIGEDKPCYVQGTLFDVVDTIELLHQAKGIAIIAHPHLIKKEQVLSSLLTLDFDGIECYYGRYASKNNQKWIKIAKKKHWAMTGGSDFHGTNRPEEHLGSSWIDENAFNVLQECIRARNEAA
jgi:3',5'-nucleoside bisphosphate phosphatase